MILNIGTVLFERTVSRHRPEPFFSKTGLERWSEATVALLRRSFYRPPFRPCLDAPAHQGTMEERSSAAGRWSGACCRDSAQMAKTSRDARGDRLGAGPRAPANPLVCRESLHVG